MTRCLSVRDEELIKPFGFRRAFTGAVLTFFFFRGLKRASRAFRSASFSLADIFFGLGCLGAGKIFIEAVGADSFHWTVTPDGMPLCVQVSFQRALSLAIFTRWSKHFDGGASASIFEKSPFSY